MGITLRIGFAMGGGASLGTFSGAALSQALKVDRDRKAPLTDKLFCTVALPTLEMLREGGKLPYPVWAARLEKNDEGARVPSDRWQLLDEVRGLEETILG